MRSKILVVGQFPITTYQDLSLGFNSKRLGL